MRWKSVVSFDLPDYISLSTARYPSSLALQNT